MTDYALILDYYSEDGGPPWDFGDGTTYATLEETWRDARTIPSQEDLDDLWDLTFPDGVSSFPTEADVNARLYLNNFGHDDLLAGYLTEANDDLTLLGADFDVLSTADKAGIINRLIYRQILIMYAINAVDRFGNFEDDMDTDIIF